MDTLNDDDGSESKTSRLAALDAFWRRRDAERTEDRHGTACIHGMRGRPQRAEGCLLPDGSTADVTVVAMPLQVREDTGIVAALTDDMEGQGGSDDASSPIDPEACVWLRRLTPGGSIARRGRLVIEPGVAVRFVDDPADGEEEDAAPDAAPLPPSLERDLGAAPGVAARIGSDLFARLLYAALCNTEWRHRDTGTPWSCSWRAGGGVVAHLRGEGDYLDWYCSGCEGLVDEGVHAEIEALGWELIQEEGAVA